MGRRMYSESQLNKMIDSKLKAYDARIPTDLEADDQPNASLIHLRNNRAVIGDSVYLKRIFGNSIIGEGSVELYNHHIKIDWAQGKFCCFTLVSSKSIQGTSAANFEQLLGTTQKPISCSGYLEKGDGTKVVILALHWKGTLAASKLYLSDGTYIAVPDPDRVNYTDVVESV